MKFKVGDKVKRVEPHQLSVGPEQGAVATVDFVTKNGWIGLAEYPIPYDSAPFRESNFRLVTESYTIEIPRTSTNLRVYISTPLKPHKFKLADIQAAVQKAGVFAFIPTTTDTTPEAGAAINKLQLELCDEVWVFGAIGRDCSWEIGYAQGLKKPVKFFKTAENEHMVKEDWMLFCAGTEVVE